MLDLFFAFADINVGQVTKPAVEMVASIPHWEMPHEFHVDFAYRDIPIRSGDVSVLTGPGVYFNEYYPWNWLMADRYDSYIEVNPVLTRKQSLKRWNLILSQLSSKPGNSPISIEVNGKMVANGFLPYVDAWREDYFPINLIEGENQIIIRLLGGRTCYWIQKLYIDPIEE